MSIATTDQIADFITRIRNAVNVGKNEILVPVSKLKVAIVEVLAKNGSKEGSYKLLELFGMPFEKGAK